VYDLRVRWLWLLALVLLAGVLVWLGSRSREASAPEPSLPPPPPELPPLPTTAAYLGASGCRPCHATWHGSWEGTAHAYALRLPHQGGFAGTFDGKPVDGGAFRAVPARSEGTREVRIQPADGRAPGNHRVTAAVGRNFEQVYLFTDSRGAWRLLPVGWDVVRGRGNPIHSILTEITGESVPHEDYDTRLVGFNVRCGHCHATRYDVGHTSSKEAGDRFASTFVDPGIGCESCHGPGSIHAAWPQQGREGDYGPPVRLLVPEELGAREVLGSCGRCHYSQERRYAIGDDPGAAYTEFAVSANVDGPGFFADGRLRSLEFHGTTQSQSACYLRGGMSCLSCHAMHGGQPRALKTDPEDDAQCTQCHEAATYAAEGHTHHDPENAVCVDCHMPRLLPAESILHPMRDHSIRSPEPQLTERFGAEHAPDACSTCHADQTAAWAREWKERWYGPASPAAERLADGIATVLALRADAAAVPTAKLAAIARDPERRLFFRDTALAALAGRMDDEARSAVREALDAPEVDLVQIACCALAVRPDPEAGRALVALLDHPARTVRLEAAFALARTGWRSPLPPAPRLVADVAALLERQYPFTELLLRAAWVRDALGDSDEMATILPTILERSPADAAPLFQRRGRSFTESNMHLEALVVYDSARGLYGANLPPLLYIDSADSLAATGNEEALSTWQFVVDNFDPGGVAHAIARARLLGREGHAEEGQSILRPIIEKLQGDPVAGEALLRLRWSLAVLSRPQ